MKLLKKVGFFDEQDENLSKTTLEESKGKIDVKLKSKIISYLKTGIGLLVIPGIVEDLLDKDRPIIGPPNVYSDGEWAWTEDVIYYVDKYSIELPEQFINSMKDNEWTVPEIENIEDLKIPGWTQNGTGS